MLFRSVSALSLLRLLHGAQVQGQAFFDGRDLLALSERDLRAIRGRDIACIFQEPMTALNPLMTIGEQIGEVLTLKQGLTGSAMRDAVAKLLEDTGIAQAHEKFGAYPHQLSGGQRQRAMIAMALACRPRLLLADEPTTALDVSLRLQILDLLSRLQTEYGLAVLLITHDLNLVRHFAARVLVMQSGHVVEQGAVATVFDDPKHPYTRQLIASRPSRDQLGQPYKSEDASLLTGRAVRVVYPVPMDGVHGWFRRGEFVAVQAADFQLAPRQTLGVIGESGSGKSTLALAALGLLPFSGELRVSGHTWGEGRAQDRQLRRRMQVVFQDPFSSLSPRMTIGEIVGEGLRIHEPDTLPEQRRAKVLRILSDVGMTEAHFPDILDRYPHEFSGGQRQRIAIARALIVEPELLVLDEPTSALDVTVQKQVLELLQRLQRERGLSYFLITHDVDVIRAMAHQVIVMRNGAVLEEGPTDQVLLAPVHPYTRELITAAGPR